MPAPTYSGQTYGSAGNIPPWMPERQYVPAAYAPMGSPGDLRRDYLPDSAAPQTLAPPQKFHFRKDWD